MQGIGQISLLTRARSNQKVLQDPNIPVEHKGKIKKIMTYKKYFNKYWDKGNSDIYSKTTFLEGEAVTYLVVASKYYEVRAHQESFWFIGKFPYLGFFHLDSAKEYAQNMQKNDYITWIRPVYAYSTLGNFSDPILSSFFTYDDYNLCELVFHELFHTIFFIKNNVALNENLANYFASKMTMDYFHLSKLERIKKENEVRNHGKIRLAMVELIQELNNLLKKDKILTKPKAKTILQTFLNDRFFPTLEALCTSLEIKKKSCFPLDRKWNNASLAAFLTYQNKSAQIKKLHLQVGLDLKGFYKYINDQYQSYLDKGLEEDFSTFLFSPLTVQKESRLVK
ncbi:MAG: aminopeptidase [Bacteriovoracaceae bacterium]|nr:aminopeptidase [Bacteriovoracaceae bacterium]